MSTRRVGLLLAAILSVTASAMAAAPKYVIAISVDGMGSFYLQDLIKQDKVPNLKAMIDQGASTLNARTDAGWAITLPNHIGMVTGRPVNDYTTPAIMGHHWTHNTDPAAGETLATSRGSYVASVFDVAHDNGLKTAMWSGKSKFSLFRDSYNAANGADDVTGEDNGKNKLDYAYIKNVGASTLVGDFTSHMAAEKYNFSFVHFQDCDGAGHSKGWGGPEYNTALMNVDAAIGNIMTLVNTDPTLAGNTIVMVTADHGGHEKGHGDMKMACDYTIPFLVWGAGIQHGDLYVMNPAVLQAPPTTDGPAGMPQYDGPQPIRNENLGNLSLQLLGLGAIPGSTVGFRQSITVLGPTAVPAPQAAVGANAPAK